MVPFSPHIKLFIRNRYKAYGTVDTGASRTCCPANLMKIMIPNYEHFLEPTNIKLRGPSGQRLKIKGIYRLTFKTGNAECIFPVCIIDHNAPILIGIDFLKGKDIFTGTHIGKPLGHLGLHDLHIPLHYNSHRKIVAISAETIPPLTAQVMESKFCTTDLKGMDMQWATDMQKPMMITQGCNNNFITMDVITQARQGGQMTCCLVNNTEEEIEIMPGQELGKAELYIIENTTQNEETAKERQKQDIKITEKQPRKHEFKAAYDKDDLQAFLKTRDLTIKRAYNDEDIQKFLKSRESYKANTQQKTSQETTLDHPHEYINLNLDNEERQKIMEGNMTLDQNPLPEPKAMDGGIFEREIDMGKPETFDLKDMIHQVKAEHLNKSQLTDLINMLWRRRFAFTRYEGDLGLTSYMTSHINTGNNRPTYQKVRPIPDHQQDQVNYQVGGMVDQYLIKPAASNWNSVLLPVKKPGTTALRLCLDMRFVNSLTVEGCTFPIRAANDAHTKLFGMKWFATLDVSSAYFAIPLDEESKQKTGFHVNATSYRFERLPMGAKHSASEWNFLAYVITAGIPGVTSYFDDLLCYAETFEELIETIELVLCRAIAANIRISFRKCKFGLTEESEIPWLGNLLNQNGLKPNQDRIDSLINKTWEDLNTKAKIKSYLGAISFLRPNIPNLAQIIKPLADMTTSRTRAPVGIKETQALTELKKALKNAIHLKLPELHKTIIVTTDASLSAGGGMISQLDEKGIERPIAFCSRTWTEAESKLSIIELECLALLYTLTHFERLLLGAKLIVRLDSRSLTYLINMKNKATKLARATTILAEYDMQIQHVSKTDTNGMNLVDFMSRDNKVKPKDVTYKYLRNPVFEKITKPEQMPDHPIPFSDFKALALEYGNKFWKEHEQEINNYSKAYNKPTLNSAIKTILPMDRERNITHLIDKCATVKQDDKEETMWSEAEHINMLDEPDKPTKRMIQLLGRELFNLDTFGKLQRADKFCNKHILTLEQNPDHAISQKFTLTKGILLRKRLHPPFTPSWVLCVPQVLRHQFISQAHTNVHLGTRKTNKQAEEAWYWPNMYQDIKTFCQECRICTLCRPNLKPQAPLHRAGTPKEPGEIIQLDLAGPYTTSFKGNKYTVTFCDTFSNYVLTLPIKNKRPEAVADALIFGWIIHFGKPQVIHTDLGSEFTNTILQLICRFFQVKRSYTSICTPNANGQVESYHNQLRIGITTCLTDEGIDARVWDYVTPFIVLYHNSTQNDRTGLKPCQLMTTGMKNPHIVPVIPRDNHLLNENKHAMAKHVRDALEVSIAYTRARTKAIKDKFAERQGKKQTKDWMVGDRVVIRKFHAFQRKGKVNTKFEVEPYYIIDLKKNVARVAKWIDLPKDFPLNVENRDLGQIPTKLVHFTDMKKYHQDINQYDFSQKLMSKFMKDLKAPIAPWRYYSENGSLKSDTDDDSLSIKSENSNTLESTPTKSVYSHQNTIKQELQNWETNRQRGVATIKQAQSWASSGSNRNPRSTTTSQGSQSTHTSSNSARGGSNNTNTPSVNSSSSHHTPPNNLTESNNSEESEEVDNVPSDDENGEDEQSSNNTPSMATADTGSLLEEIANDKTILTPEEWDEAMKEVQKEQEQNKEDQELDTTIIPQEQENRDQPREEVPEVEDTQIQDFNDEIRQEIQDKYQQTGAHTKRTNKATLEKSTVAKRTRAQRSEPPDDIWPIKSDKPASHRGAQQNNLQEQQIQQERQDIDQHRGDILSMLIHELRANRQYFQQNY